MKKIRNYLFAGIVMIMMFSLTGCSLLEVTMSDDSENNAKVTILNNETLKIESPVEGKVKIEVIMLDDGVESNVTKEVAIERNEEKTLKVSDFETAKYKTTNNSKFSRIVEVETVTELTGVDRVINIIVESVAISLLFGWSIVLFLYLLGIARSAIEKISY